MKRNNLTTAVLAGITGVAGIASVSNAVNLNADGVGQVLIYPYYTVNNGITTLISVVNTTDAVKAIKVRFLEGKNSREVLDFNLYMSPYDVWTAALNATTSTATAVGASFADQDSVILNTADTSCTVPAINGQEFLPFAFSGVFNDTLVQNMSRATEGHFEMIEMGEVINDDAVAATHLSGDPRTPQDCPQLVSNWRQPTGQWFLDPSVNIVDPDGSGGLFGSVSLVDVAEGFDVAYNADAFQAYSTAQQHANPGDLFPNLATGNSSQSIVFYQGNAVVTDWLTSSVEALSASYMHRNVYAEYALDESINAKTEWVVTFPTKSFYVDTINSIAPPPVEPFTQRIANNIGACEPYAVVGLFDREENSPTNPPGDVIPSPTPPGLDPTIPVFCWETNVLEFHYEEVDLASTGILGSSSRTNLASPYRNGWVNLQFNQLTDNGVSNPGGFVQEYLGLPVTGFAVQKYTNQNAAPGLLAQYGGLFPHRGLKNISSATS